MGVAWNNATLPSGVAGLNSISFGNSAFIGVNEDGQILRSVDGKVWSSVSNTPAITWNSVTFGGNTFVALGNDGAMPVFSRSTDGGSTFSAPAVMDGSWSAYDFKALTYGGGIFVALDAKTPNDQFTAVSTDNGQTWVQGEDTDSGDIWESVTYGVVNGGGIFVSSSSGPSFEFSTDPVNVAWDATSVTNNEDPLGGERPSNIGFNGTQFMFILQAQGGVMYKYFSTDGQLWQSRVAVTGLPHSRYSGLIWDGSAWLIGAAGTGTGIFRSIDGVTWTQVDNNNTQWSTFAVGNGIVVAGGAPKGSTTQGLNSTIAVGWSEATSAPAPAPQPSEAALAETGVNALPYLTGGFTMIALGLVMIIARRKKMN